MSDETDYFHVFGLSRQDTRQVNYDKLQDLLYKENRRNGRKAEARQLLLKQAVSSFKNEIEYQNYLKKLNARSSATDSNSQAELEKEQQKATWEKSERRRLEIEAEKLKDKIEKEKISKQPEPTAPPKTGWRIAGDLVKAVLKPPPHIEQAVDGIADLLSSNKQTQASQPSVNQQPTINLSGNWRDFDGAFYAALNYSITHSGSWLKMQGKTWGILAMEGEGIVSGQFVRIDEYKFANGITGQLDLSRSTDGRSLKGTCTNFSTGLTFNVHFVRI